MDLLTQIPFEQASDDAWAQWDLAHVLTHNRIYDNAVKNGYPINNYPLAMDEPRPTDNWKNVHQQIHQSLYQVLGMTGGLPDLTDVDFNDATEFEDWHLLHALIHNQLNLKLGLM